MHEPNISIMHRARNRLLRASWPCRCLVCAEKGKQDDQRRMRGERGDEVWNACVVAEVYMRQGVALPHEASAAVLRGAKSGTRRRVRENLARQRAQSAAAVSCFHTGAAKTETLPAGHGLPVLDAMAMFGGASRPAAEPPPHNGTPA